MNREKPARPGNEAGIPGRLHIRSLWPHFVAPVAVALILLCFYRFGP